MTKKINTTHIYCLLIFSLIYSNPIFATRYDLISVNEPVVNAINNVGTIVGTNRDGKPYARRFDPETNTYPDETDVAEGDRAFNIILPTDFDNSEQAEPPVSNIDYTEIHVLDINNELEEGGGGTIVGWYVDSNGLTQSVLWKLEEIKNQNILEYSFVILPPHTLSPTYCTGNPEADFPNTECMFGQDSDLIYRATLCAGANENWETPNNIFVDKDFRYQEQIIPDEDDPENIPPTIIPAETPDCSSGNTIPICEYKAEKLADGKKTIQGDDGPLEVDAFKYVLNEDYDKQECILKEHAEFVVQAIQCKNENENFKAAGDALVIKCDDSSRAIGINNAGIVIGISNKPDGTDRPVFWVKDQDKTIDGQDIYNSGDLGTERTTVDLNEEQEINNIGKSDEIVKNFYSGYPTAIDKSTNAIVGMLHVNGPNSPARPSYWNDVKDGDVEYPAAPLLPPNPETTISQACLDSSDTSEFTTPVTPTSAAAGIIIGWYEDVNANPKAVMWTPCLSKDEQNITTEQLKSGHLPTLNEDDDRKIGKALDNSSAGETIGTTLVDVTDENGDLISENHAFYRTLTCGIQDINELLATPITDRSLILESAYFISMGVPPTPILALGKVTETENVNPYVLTPSEVFTDLEVRINSNHKALTVGDQHSINIIVENKGAVDNESTSSYATCIFFKLTATVYTQDTYEDKIKQAQADGLAITEELKKTLENYPKIEDELVGGLTFDEYDNSNPNVVCVTNRIEIVCAMERLDPGNAVQVTVKTTPRPLLADRTIRTTASVFSTESETPTSLLNNTSFELISVEREACFIATAAYGSYLAPEVKMLREFRDNVLLQSTLGKQIVNFYYDISPPFANYIANNEALRNITRWLLSPIIYLVAYPIVSLILLLLLLSFSSRYYQLKRQKVT